MTFVVTCTFTQDMLYIGYIVYIYNVCNFAVNELTNKVHNSITKQNSKSTRHSHDTIGITTPENGNHNGPDLVQAFQKKWWVKFRFYSALNLPLPLRLKCTGGGNQNSYGDVISVK